MDCNARASSLGLGPVMLMIVAELLLVGRKRCWDLEEGTAHRETSLHHVWEESEYSGDSLKPEKRCCYGGLK